MNRNEHPRIVEAAHLAPILQAEQATGRAVVFTNGCFDLLHVGHLRYLRAARDCGDLLVVALNTDESMAAIKGPKRPLVPLEERLELVAALEPVSYVTWFGEPDPLAIVSLLQPDVLVKGADWGENEIIGADVVKARGGRVERIELTEGRSTSSLIDLIVERYGK